MELRKSLLFFSAIICAAICADVQINIVISFASLDKKPTSILMPNLCWSNYKLKTLTKELGKEGIPFASSLQPNRTEYILHQAIVVVDMSCSQSERFLLKANEEELFKSPYRWLLLTDEGSEEKLTVLEQLNILIDSDLVVAKMMAGNRVIFIEAYKISATSEIIYNTRASWTENHVSSNSIENISNTSLIEYNKKDSESVVGSSKRKYGVMVDHRRSKILSSRRTNIRRHRLTMVNIITDSNDTKNHMNDRLIPRTTITIIALLLLSITRFITTHRTFYYPSVPARHLHQDSITKMSYGVVKICFEMLNASEKLIFTHTWGYKDENGNYNGIVEYLRTKQADLGTLSIYTKERTYIYDYIAMVGSTAVRFVFREPPLAYISNIYALPFTAAVWLAIFICVLGCALFLYITSRWEATVSMHHLQLDGSWADVLILIIGAVLQQGCTQEPRFAAGRIVMLILFIAMTILYSAYSANIVVLLRAPSSSVKSLTDLLDSPIKLGASDLIYNRYFFANLKEPLRKEIYNKKIAPKGKKPNYFTMKEGIEKIRQGLFAFHMELNPGYRLIQETYQEDEKCDLVEIDYINEIDPWVPGQKRAALKDLYKINFIKIREVGIQSCIQRRLHVPKPKCSGTVSTFSSVGITDMYSALLVTLYGVLLAPAVLLVEILHHRLIVARKNRKMAAKDEDNSDTVSQNTFLN